MHALIQAFYWLALSTWFGAVLFSVIAPPVLLRVMRAADPTLPRVLSVNLNQQHSTLLASHVVGELLATLFRVEAASAAVLLPALAAQWLFVDRAGVAVLLPLLVTGLYLVSILFMVYGWRVVLPRVLANRTEYIDNADDPDLANPALDKFDRYSNELSAVVRNLLFALMGVILFSANLLPHVQTLSAP